MAVEQTDPPRHDLVVIGGGPAGMSAALTAGRALLDTVIVNAENPRNAVTTASHGFLTRDGAHPSELLAISKQQLIRYDTVRYVNDSVTGTTKTDDGFEVSLANGELLATTRLIIATGQTDDVSKLNLDGIEHVYGKTVYPCIFCDGFEHRGERLALFGADAVVHYAPMVHMWSRDLAVFTNGDDLPADDKAQLEGRGVAVHTAPVRQLESTDGRLSAIELETGERIERDAGFISADYSTPATTFAEELGATCSANDWGMLAVDASETGATAVTGLYVIGDARTGFGGLIASAAEGAACAAEIAHEIAAHRWGTL